MQNGHQDSFEPRKPNLKKTLTVLMISLVILLPTILAIIITAYSELNDDKNAFEGVEVVLYDKDRNELFRESGDDMNTETDSLVKILSAIESHRDEYSPIPEGAEQPEPLIASINKDGVLTELTCYFSFYSGRSWCMDSNGEKYSIPDMYNEYFIHSIYAETLYASSTPPVLSTHDGDVILPSNASWSYQNASGQWMTATHAPNDERGKTFRSTGGISLSFSESPSQCKVRLFENNEQIYDGDLEGISTVPLTDDEVSVRINATWDKYDGCTYYGTQNYSFVIRVQNIANFALSAEEISTNNPILLTATNVTELANLTFSSEDTSFVPTFHLNGTTAYTLIPYPKDASEAGLESLSFTVTYGVAAQTFTVALKQGTRDVGPETCATLGIDLSYFTSTIDEIFIGSQHARPDSVKFSLGTSFGSIVTLGQSSLRSPFTEYVCRSSYGLTVNSCYAGQVCFVGSSITLGNYVVIDVGLDVKLWYCYLGEVYVKVGDIIAMGENIGTTGSLKTHLDGAQGFAYMFTYLDYVVAPECFLDDKIALK